MDWPISTIHVCRVLDTQSSAVHVMPDNAQQPHVQRASNRPRGWPIGALILQPNRIQQISTTSTLSPSLVGLHVATLMNSTPLPSVVNEVNYSAISDWVEQSRFDD
jgi:hypothetical protein